MQQALHDPQRGYYARKIRGIGGGRGDFTTVPMRGGDGLSRAIARWVMESMRATGCRDLIEVGPGEGRLTRDVLRHLPWLQRRRVRMHFVETSPVLTERQREATRGIRIEWHPDMSNAMEACGGRALIFSNELVDAFPVRIFVKTVDTWKELGVEINPEGYVVSERLLDVDSLPDSSIFEIQHPEGQRVEVHESYRTWLHEWLPQWRAGELLTVDYGADAGSLYHRRPNGTVRGYFMHQRMTGPEVYQNIGMQDLTADVNFTDLARWAGPWCQSHAPQTLAAFLREKLGKAVQGDEADEDLAGGAFRVIRQQIRPATSPTPRAS